MALFSRGTQKYRRQKKGNPIIMSIVHNNILSPNKPPLQLPIHPSQPPEVQSKGEDGFVPCAWGHVQLGTRRLQLASRSKPKSRWVKFLGGRPKAPPLRNKVLKRLPYSTKGSFGPAHFLWEFGILLGPLVISLSYTFYQSLFTSSSA